MNDLGTGEGAWPPAGTAPQCYACTRLRRTPGWVCDAFERIPKEILINAVDHRQPYEGDGGMMFVPIEPVIMSDAATGKGAGVLFSTPDGQILLLRRAADDEDGGEWSIPGGKVEDGETTLQAAVRETEEETGYKVNPDDLVEWTRRRRNGFIFTTYRTMVMEPFAVTLSDEHDASQWVSRKDLRTDAAFEESEHPRAGAGTSKGGQFVAKGEGGGGLPEHIAKIKIPPAWTDVHYDPNPRAALLVVGRDAKGREQRIYSEEFSHSQAEAKFRRIEELDKKFQDMLRQNEEARHDPKTREVAEVVALIMATGIRPGGAGDTGAEKQAYGATTLKGEHVYVEPDGSVRLKFVGKKGVDLDLPVADKKVAAVLQRRAKRVGPSGDIFPSVSASTLLRYVHSLDGGGFKTKDFRTLLGTRQALKEMKTFKVPRNPTQYKKQVREVAKRVAAVLGNTPIVALQSYISPEIFSGWRARAGA